VENNFVSICTMIAPRMEISFLEEWIEHHLDLGVDKIFIYNTGFNILSTKGENTQRKLGTEEVGVKWQKKPDAEYHIDLSDEEITNLLNGLIKKYSECVKLIDWFWRDEFDKSNHKAQCLAYENCTKNFKSEWWLNIDPDEYVVVKSHENIKEFLKQDIRVGKHKRRQVTSFWLGQRVFQERKRGNKTKEIFNYGYDLPEHCKCIVKSPINDFKKPIHFAECSVGVSKIVQMEKILFHHYRGHPKKCASRSHASYFKDHPDMNFNNIDKSMKRFLK